MGSMESSGERSLGFTEIETTAESLRRSDIFHVVKEVLGFILYMHQQIPVVLQHLEQEFDSLKEEFKQLVCYSSSIILHNQASFHRKTNMRKNEVKSSIKKLEKLMGSLSTLFSALQEAIDASPGIQGVTFLLGGSLARPHYVYEIFFSRFRINSDSAKNNIKSKVAEVISRKVVRGLISSGAGSLSFPGPTKLILLIKCTRAFSLPLHFLPKRDFRYNKKVLPIKLHIKCKIEDQAMSNSHYNPEENKSSLSADIDVNDMIW
ncbi:hypothetical protein KSP39_PZI003845 [Platanthera zijinensis]|uniref:Uncharacterized protein n=1 Tax=Platanthera zijinensis TaxID=2320716 RepID=A0AAP0GC63_9ASPA